MDKIKDAFSKVKQEIEDLKFQLFFINQQLEDIKRTIEQQEQTKLNPTEKPENQTIQHIIPTQEEIPTDNLPLYALKSQNMPISIGNQGVPTNKQTNQQTNQHIQENQEKTLKIEQNPEKTAKTDTISHIQQVSQVLESLDSIKKEIRTNFKHLTNQEILVFSSIYALEEQGFVVDYSLISQKLSLSETSIRDYTHKLIKKGIPIIKIKENNKKITLKISPELKKIASLQTILALREL